MKQNKSILRPYHFNAGPAMLPSSVLMQIQEELLDYEGTGCSILEMGHRTPEFREILEKTQETLSRLLHLPHYYKLLFLPGGATLQFSLIPMHFLKSGQTADYFKTGNWSEKAIQEAKRYGEVHVVASSEEKEYTLIPEPSEWIFSPRAAYCHYTANETIHGVQFHQIPEVPENVPLISDMTSCVFSEPLEVSRFGLIYASAQKNLGIAGLTLLVIRDDLLKLNNTKVPSTLHYLSQAQQDSLLNTPPTFAIYVMGLMAQWMLEQGGLEALGEVNQRKSKKLYDFIDSTHFYENSVRVEDRSFQNVIFSVPTKSLETLFLQEAKEASLCQLQGHRSRGGLRASLYNAMPEEAVDSLIQFMSDFEKRYG